MNQSQVAAVMQPFAVSTVAAYCLHCGLQVNDTVLYGRNHVEVVSVLRDSPQHVRIITARPRDTLHSLRSIPAAIPHSLFKAKSEQVTCCSS